MVFLSHKRKSEQDTHTIFSFYGSCIKVEKLKLFVDFDNTIANTSKAVVEILNKRYGTNSDYRKLYKYDFQDLFPGLSKKELCAIFNSKELFDTIEFVDGCKDTLSSLQEYFDIHVVTVITQKENLSYKQEWLSSHFGNKLKITGVFDCHSDTEKRQIDMKNGIMIDDRIQVLKNVNAKVKILFRNGTDVEWNQVSPNDMVYVVDYWTEINDILNFYKKIGRIF